MRDILGFLSYLKKKQANKTKLSTQAEELPGVGREERKSLVDGGQVVSLGPEKKSLMIPWNEQQLGAIVGGRAVFLFQVLLVDFTFSTMRNH